MDGHGRQLPALDEFEEGPSARGYIRDAVGNAVLVDGGQRIAAAGDRKSVARGDRLRQDASAVPELIEFEDTDRPVPDDRSCIGHERCEIRSRLRPDIQYRLVVIDLA